MAKPNPLAANTASANGALFVISAPSGAGKTSLTRAVVEQLNSKMETVAFSTSSTTRPQRPGEVNGSDYHFLSVDEFKAKIDSGDFLEHAEVFGNYYGTSQSAVEQALASGRDVILEIDWQGAQQVRKQLPQAQSIFILPPSLAALESRLQGRGTDSAEVVQRRMDEAKAEIAHYDEFDFVIFNDDFDTALAELQSVFIAQRQGLERQRLAHSEALQAMLA